MKKFVLILSIAAWSASAAVDPKLFVEDVKFLASKDMRGRGTGTPELEKAAAFIANKFRDFRLRPVEGTSYYQAFDVTTNARLGGANRFQYTIDGSATALRFPEEFQPFNFSSAGTLSGEVVFAGYGITAPEYNYDDYAGLDVKGKIVLVLRHEPQEFDEKSVFSGKVYTEHAQFSSKAINAKMHGAAGVILINDVNNHRTDTDQMEKFSNQVGPGDAGIPFIQVSAATAEKWIAAAGKNLDDISAAIDKELKPQSFAFGPAIRIEAKADVKRDLKTVHNVIGYLPGETDEYIVIGAHYDHLGLGEQFSMAPALAGTIHPGADDNASGTAGVIELARWFSKQPKLKRGIVFMCFAGEELGLLGSSYFVNHPELPLAKDVAMINMDMIGRGKEGKYYIGGVPTGTSFRKVIDEVAPKYHLNLDFSDTTGYGSSDHTSFTTKQVPILFFFSGLHADYHKPSDTWDKIDGPGTAKLLDMISEIAADIANDPGRPQFVRVNEPKNPHGGAAVAGAATSGYGPWFGSVPDFAETKDGVRFADVTPNSPAAKAGLKGGDVMTSFDGKKIQNLYDFTYVLRTKKPGDEVEVVVTREGKPLTVKVTLEKRK